ncbi:uncharacterized protein LOC142529939 [Primulina tabacum]|uniref:uncharacterized protein LOC142529939 n=1 Tax=Primulina tabacum TaxID=48773 RepID=UPI003F5931F5
MTCADEEWVAAAMTDDAMVVELLVRLHHASTPLPLHSAVVPLEWSVRQRRSKPLYPNNAPKKSGHRDSPTTALSLSGATSLSGGSGGGCEESSLPPLSKLCHARRSEVNSSTQKSSSKRSRKKKNLAELKEEENSLIKERRDLKREIAALRANLENQRSVNERLKRMKLDLPPIQERDLTSLPILPDLNIPFDEFPSSDVVCGAS